MDNNSEYNLYTEKITNKGKTKKRVKRFLLYIFMTVFLSTIAAVVFFEVNGYLKKISTDEKTKEKVSIIIPDESKSVDATSTASPDSTSQSEVETVYVNENNEILQVAKQSYGSLVKVSAYINTSAVFQTLYEKVCMGAIIIGEDRKFYILCDFGTVDKADNIVIRTYNGIEKQATLLAGDQTTGIAILSMELSEEEYNRNQNSDFNKTRVFEIANSNGVMVDDTVVAVGDICNGEFTYNIGRITNNTNSEYGTDSMYEILNTSITCGMGYNGVLLNNKGQVIGVVTSKYESKYGKMLVSAYSINSIKNVINCLSNGKELKTIGIEGREVTSALSKAYNMPRGIYVNSVSFNSPAFKGNIQPGDIIKSVNSEAVYSFDRFQELILGADENESLVISLAKRDNNGYKDVEVKLSFGN